jgi:hypothetical protein
MLMMIDNYDSFTYNLVQYLGELGSPVTVYRNDRIAVADIAEMAPQAIVIASRYSASVSVTNASPRPSARASSMPTRPCTARRR